MSPCHPPAKPLRPRKTPASIFRQASIIEVNRYPMEHCPKSQHRQSPPTPATRKGPRSFRAAATTEPGQNRHEKSVPIVLLNRHMLMQMFYRRPVEPQEGRRRHKPRCQHHGLGSSDRNSSFTIRSVIGFCLRGSPGPSSKALERDHYEQRSCRTRFRLFSSEYADHDIYQASLRAKSEPRSPICNAAVDRRHHPD